MAKNIRKWKNHLKIATIFSLLALFVLTGNSYAEVRSHLHLPSSSSALRITVVGEKKNALTKSLWAAANNNPGDNTVVHLEDRTGGKKDTYPGIPSRAAYLCIAGRCSLPITSPSEIEEIKKEMLREANE